MPLLSGNTKKVSVYGRKAEVRVVNRQSAFKTLENDENDPFGFFKPSQPKPKATYGRSRTSVLPLLSEDLDSEVDSNNDSTLDDQLVTDQSSAYDTANSSVSFHSTRSSAGSSPTAKQTLAKTTSKSAQRGALASRALNTGDRTEKKGKGASGPTKSDAAAKIIQDDIVIISTPKAQRNASKRVAVSSPQTVTKPPRSKASTLAESAATNLPTESTPPPSQPIGRAPRRAAQAARMAIEDYDFTDRDVTPRRPVPTKSYFVEKARQLAELALEEQQESQQLEQAIVSSTRTSAGQSRKSMAPAKRTNARKSMATRPRHTSVLTSTLSSAVVISDSSLSSTQGMSDSSFDGASTSQSSFSLVIPCPDEPRQSAPRKSAFAKSKAKQNKRVTRRIAADSDDEDGSIKDEKDNSDEEGEQDPTAALAAQVADLAVAEGDDVSTADGHLSKLLAAVSQTKTKTFADVIQKLRALPDSTKTATSRRRLEKIGEASYSEVFKIFAPASSSTTNKTSDQEALVLKIIPISAPTMPSNVDDDIELPYTSPAADVEREIRLMQLIARESKSEDSFVSLRAAHVVRGAYPAALLQAWDRWDTKRRAKTGEGAENIRPSALTRKQVYALLVMTDGGVDLESLKVKSWVQAASIFWQVVSGLSQMEAKYEFEHRDLHWGNILVQSTSMDKNSDLVVAARRGSSGRSNESEKDADSVSSWLLDPSRSGVKATIIDFTLSRASSSPVTKGRGTEPSVLYYPFDDEALFEGSGDPQFEVYREMRIGTKGDWQSFCPATNLLWLRYLAHKLIDVKCKACKVPKPSSDPNHLHEMQAYASLQDAAARLDSAAQVLLGEAAGARGAKKGDSAGRKSLHPRSRKSVLPPAAPTARKGRATMAVTPLLLHLTEESDDTLRSASVLMSLIS